LAVAIRCGVVDVNDPPTPQSPIKMACPKCGGRDAACEQCGDDGRVSITSIDVPAWCFRVASMSDMYIDHGVPAVAGGQLDQSNWFYVAAMFCHASRERILADRYGQQT